MRRARERKMRGNPPGKANGPLGDQLTWEQVLRASQGKKRIWLISKDNDYGIAVDGKGMLNSFLFAELLKAGRSREVHFFDTIPKGIAEYTKVAGVESDKPLSDEEVEELSEQERAVPVDEPSDSYYQQMLKKSTEEYERVGSGSIVGTRCTA